MEAKRYTYEKIIGVLKAHGPVTEVTDLVHEHGISEQSFYHWKSK